MKEISECEWEMLESQIQAAVELWRQALSSRYGEIECEKTAQTQRESKGPVVPLQLKLRSKAWRSEWDGALDERLLEV